MGGIWGTVLVIFAAVVFACMGGYNVWAARYSPDAKRVAARLKMLTAGTLVSQRLRVEREREVARLPWLQEQLVLYPWGQRIVAFVAQSGGSTSAADVIVLSAVLGVVGVMLPSLLGKPAIFGGTLGLLMLAFPWWRLLSARTKRIAKLEEQLPDALDLMGRSLRAGHALPTAIRLCGEEMPEPLGREFTLLADETTYGVPFAVALQNLSKRVPVPDIGFFVVAVMIQRESGGNMAELLANISSIVRQRLKLHGEVRTLSAEGKLSGWIMSLLPFGIGLLMNLIKPGYMNSMFEDPLGIKMIGVAMFMMAVGIIWMRQVVQIRV